MNTSKIYKKDDYWYVDFIDSNYEYVPAVGIFKLYEDAVKASKEWEDEKSLENLGESSW